MSSPDTRTRPAAGTIDSAELQRFAALAAELGAIVQRRCWELAKEGEPTWEMAAGEAETLINAAWRCMASVDGLIEQDSRRVQEREARLERERQRRGESPDQDTRK